MRKNSSVLFIFVLLFFYSTSIAQNYGAKSIFKKYNDAVVVIYACDSYGKPIAQGSGVVLNSQGLIVTNYHVCEGSANIKIKHEDLVVEDVKILGGDRDDDIMFLKVPENNFNYIPAGNSDNLEIGQKVYALGSPLGFENSITEGIVNGIRKISRYSGDNYIQISASISHGSSGGALITAGGKLIGITTATIEDGQNINFAIPINKILESGIYAENKYDDAITDKKEKKTRKKKKTGDITSTDTEKKVKKPRKKKKDEDEIYSSSTSKSISKVPGRTGSRKSEDSSYEELIESGKSAIASKNFNSAIEFFSKAIKLEPQSSLAYYARALCYLNLKQYSEALSDLNFFISDRQDFAEAYLFRAFIHQLMERYTDAINDYSAVIRLDKTNELAIFGLGDCYYELENYEKAVVCFTAYILLDKSKPAAYYYRGVSLLELGNDYEDLDACSDLQKAYLMGFDDAKEYIQQYCK